MTQSDFQRRFSEDVPLAPGSVRGVRTWGVHRVYGGRDVTLMGQAGGSWDVDGNVAECLTPDQKWANLNIGNYSHERCGGIAVDCTCGFYAYWTEDHRDRFGAPLGRGVVGVIEGWGKVTIGSRGFRCEKARILAITPGDIDGVRWQQVRDAYPDLPAYALVDDMLAAWPPSEAPEGFEDEPEPTFNSGGMLPSSTFVKAGQMIGRVGSTGPHLHFAAPTLSVHVNSSPYLDSLRQAAIQLSNAYAVPPSLLGIGDDPPQTEDDKRQAALDKVRNRNTGPSRNPFRRRRSQR